MGYSDGKGGRTLTKIDSMRIQRVATLNSQCCNCVQGCKLAYVFTGSFQLKSIILNIVHLWRTEETHNQLHGLRVTPHFLQRRASEFHILFPFVKFRYYFISSLMKKGLGQTNGLKLSLKSSDHSQGSERAQNKQRVLFLLLFSKRYEKHEQRNKVKPRALFQRNR